MSIKNIPSVMNAATHAHYHLAERLFPNNVKVMHEAKYSNVKSERQGCSPVARS